MQENGIPLNSVTAKHLETGSVVEKVLPPKILVVTNKLPFKLERITRDVIYTKTFPYDEPLLVGYKLAMDKLNKMKVKVDIQFVFGGSVLNAIKAGDTRNKYVAMKIPTTQTILVTKVKGYEVNPSQKGYQFERLMTGRQAKETDTYSHMQLLQLNGKNVLFIAETDGVDSQKKAVEIKLGQYSGCSSSFAIHTILQMISNGSNTLVYGSTDRDDVFVESVENKYLGDLIEEHVPTNQEKSNITNKITKTLTELEWKIEGHGVYRVRFDNRKTVTADVTNCLQVLPPTSETLCYLNNITPNLLAQDNYRVMAYRSYNRVHDTQLYPKTLWTNVWTEHNPIIRYEQNTEFHK